MDTLECSTCTVTPSPTAWSTGGSAAGGKRSSSRPLRIQVSAKSRWYNATTGPVSRKCVSRQVSNRSPPSMYSCPMFMPPE